MLSSALIRLVAACLPLAGCGSGSTTRLDAGDYVGGSVAIECAPFARALTGISLSGAAADWWPQAAGRYLRSQRPEVGSLLVFRRSGRMPYGHVAVVTRVLSERQITVTQANWVHHRVTEEQPVIDISAEGDWSTVRVWWPPAGQMGVAAFAVHGFIRPDHPAAHDRLVAETPIAVRLAAGR